MPNSPDNPQQLFDEFHFDFDRDELQRFLGLLTPIFERGFGEAEIGEVLTEARSLRPDRRAVCEFNVRYRGRDTRLTAALFALEDVEFPTLFLYSIPDVIMEVERALSRFTEDDADED